ncbi:hypothetical protein DL98DRAFT_513444 [Cadophora sp. DSE1049]|nr:hypothetical protein DL98DRAFT_513444 [Cadophora sp. DSE1049]
MSKVSYDICRSSKDAMTSIFQRFKQQHGLKHAPIVFVLGAIVAMNVTITLSRDQSPGGSVIMDTDFSLLDSALKEMSETWKLAADARTKFRCNIGPRGAFQNDSSSGDVPTQLYEQGDGHSNLGHCSTHDINITNTSYGQSVNSEEEVPVNSDPYFWDPLGIPESVFAEWLNF